MEQAARTTALRPKAFGRRAALVVRVFSASWFGICDFPTPASVPWTQVRHDLEPNLPERATHGKVSTRIRTARTPSPSFTALAARSPSLGCITWK
jgi:hypothetical protein